MKARKILFKFIAVVTSIVMCFALLPDKYMGTIVAQASTNDPIVVVLDPGHGGNDNGACNESLGTNEKNSNWEMTLACKAYLENYENVKVILTREKRDEYSSLSSRVQVAEKNKADLFVSLHSNSTSYEVSAVNGCEVYRSVVEPFASNTNQLAADICANLSSLGLTNRGVKTRKSTILPDDDYYTVIADCVMSGIPSLIVEHAFVNNKFDASFLNSPTKLKAMGEADAKAIAKYFNLKWKGSGNSGYPTIEVTPFMEEYGWIATSPSGMAAGFVTYRKNDHRDRRIEAFKIDLNNDGVSGDVVYQAYNGGTGWQSEVSSGNVAGSTTDGKIIEAVKINLTGDLASKYDIYYRVLSDQSGWLGWASNGKPAGKIGFASELRAIQVRLIAKGGNAPTSNVSACIEVTQAPEDAKIAYTTHVQSYGWETAEAYDGLTSGTSGQSKRLEGIIIRNNTGMAGDIEYQVHCQTYGWMDWKTSGEMAGTSGESKRLEAIRIKLTGELSEKYDVYYRVHAQNFGWLDWAKNGEAAGTSGYSKRLEAIEIVLVEKDGAAPGATTRPYVSKLVTYKTHVQTYGWQSYVSDGEVSGTSGQSKRLEGIRISNGSGVPGSVRYKVHCQTYGWMDWVSDDAMAGTTGESKRLEGICIELDGELGEKYDVYYRVHVQTYGWLDWAKNGEPAGTEGLSRRLEGIQIMFVPKDKEAPGPTDKPYINGNLKDNSEDDNGETTTEVITETTTENTTEEGDNHSSEDNNVENSDVATPMDAKE